MSISPVCDNCGHELDEPGGILVSPPQVELPGNGVYKDHLCVKCYGLVKDLMDSGQLRPRLRLCLECKELSLADTWELGDMDDDNILICPKCFAWTDVESERNGQI